MRIALVLLASTSLAACGGAGLQTAGGSPATPTGTTSASPASAHTFVNPTEPKTYNGIGAARLDGIILRQIPDEDVRVEADHRRAARFRMA